MRILFLGGTRFIGAAAVRQLHAAGHGLTLFTRGKLTAPPPAGVELLSGDRNELQDHAGRLRAARPDVIIDMCCVTGAQAELAVRVAQSIGVPRYVLISSCDVYRSYGILHGSEIGPLDNAPQAEFAPLRTKLYPYRGSEPRGADDPQPVLADYDKIPCEQAVWDGFGPKGIVLRLPMVYGPGDYQQRLLPYLRRMDDGRPVILLGTGAASWRGCRGYVEDVAHAIALAATVSPATPLPQPVYNVAEPVALTERDWVERIAAAAGWSGDLRELPDELLPGYVESDSGWRQHLVVDTTRIRQDLGYAEPTAADSALRATVAWQRQHYPDPLPAGMFDYVAEDALLAAQPSI